MICVGQGAGQVGPLIDRVARDRYRWTLWISFIENSSYIHHI